MRLLLNGTEDLPMASEAEVPFTGPVPYSAARLILMMADKRRRLAAAGSWLSSRLTDPGFILHPGKV